MLSVILLSLTDQGTRGTRKRGGHIGRLKVHPWKYFCIFCSFELKLCKYSKKSYVFFISDFNSFWRENDVTRLTVKFKFQVMAKTSKKSVTG